MFQVKNFQSEVEKMSNDIDNVIINAAAHFVNILAEHERISKRSKIHPYLLGRSEKGRFVKDFDDLRKCLSKFRENFRMDPTTFEKLLSLIEKHLQPKANTRPSDGITPKEKLAIVLEFFACGTLQRHISSVYRISKQHFGKIIEQVCDALCEALSEYIPLLNSSQAMVDIANNFHAKWQFPNTVGAVDGKHVAIKRPRNSGSLFYNYKGFYSIVLMAIADGNYKFIYLDVGAYGSEGDASIFAESTLGKSLFQDNLPFPNDVSVGADKIPYFLVADDAFPLHKRIMKPFVPKRGKQLAEDELVFNYRLSRARRCIENSFGILCSRFYCLARTMFCSPDKAQKVITACCYLHNFLLDNNKDIYCPPNFADRYDETGQLIEGEWRKKIPQNSLYSTTFRSTQGRHPCTAKSIREKLKLYDNSPCGSIPWQRKAMYLE